LGVSPVPSTALLPGPPNGLRTDPNTGSVDQSRAIRHLLSGKADHAPRMRLHVATIATS